MKDTPSDPLKGQVVGRRTARIQGRKGEGAQSVVYIAEPYLAMIYRNWCLRGDKDPGVLIHGAPYVRGRPIADEALLRKVEAAAEDVEDTLLQNLSWPERKDYARKNFGIDYRGEAVAIKMLKPSLSRNRELQERFGREVWIMKELQHPNIVGFIDYGTHDLQNQELYYVILEYVKDARSWRGLAPLEPRPAVKVCVRILRGLAYAHGKGVVHRDLKPGNVLADFSTLAGEDPDIRITDFGLATVTNPAFRDELGEDYKELTKSVETLGTPAYMSPEHVRNPKLVREYSDVFSASSLFYNLFTGRPPFEGSILEISDRIRYHRLPPPGGPAEAPVGRTRARLEGGSRQTPNGRGVPGILGGRREEEALRGVQDPAVRRRRKGCPQGNQHGHQEAQGVQGARGHRPALHLRVIKAAGSETRLRRAHRGLEVRHRGLHGHRRRHQDRPSGKRPGHGGIRQEAEG